MTTKKVLLALAASSLFAFGYTAPVWAEDPAPPAEGATMPVPADPDSAMETGDIAPDAAAEGAGDAAGTEAGTDAGGEPPPQPE